MLAVVYEKSQRESSKQIRPSTATVFWDISTQGEEYRAHFEMMQPGELLPAKAMGIVSTSALARRLEQQIHAHGARGCTWRGGLFARFRRDLYVEVHAAQRLHAVKFVGLERIDAHPHDLVSTRRSQRDFAPRGSLIRRNVKRHVARRDRTVNGANLEFDVDRAGQFAA